MTDEENTQVDDDRLEKLEKHATKTEGRLDTIEKTQGHHSTKLDQIFTAVTRAEGRPQFDLWKAVSSVRDVLAIGAVIGSLSVWLVLTLTAAENRVTETKLAWQVEKIEWQNERIKRLEAAFEWTAKTEKIKP